MEKFNFEVNVRVLVPLRMLLNFLEAGNWLDKDNPGWRVRGHRMQLDAGGAGSSQGGLE